MLDIPRLFKKSIYSPSFYRSLSERRIGFSFRYFFYLAGILSVVMSLVFSIAFIPGIYGWLKSFGPALMTSYPDDLKIGIKGGEVEVNSTEPVAVPMPTGLAPQGHESVGNLLVVDTSEPFSTLRFDKLNTFLLLTRNEVAFRASDNEIRVRTLDGIPNFFFDKERMLMFIYQIQSVSRTAYPILFLLITVLLALGFMAFFSVYLFLLLFWALLIMFMASLMERPIRYAKAYQIGLHAVTIPLVLGALSLLVPAYFHIRFLPTVLTVVIAWLNLRERPKARVIK